MRGIGCAVASAALASVLSGCSGSEPPAGPPAIIVAADAGGAIVFDGQGFLGVRRDGTVVWRAAADATSATPSGCLASCPDAVLSGSAMSANDGQVPDPPPVFIVDGQRRAAQLPGVKRTVLTAAGPGDFVLSTGDGAGAWWLELHGDKDIRRVPVGGFQTSWQESADRRHALAITTLDQGEHQARQGEHQARWFERDATGWRPADPGVAVAGSTSCVQPNGERALLIGQRPAVLDRGGRQDPVTDLELAGTCALAGVGGILADLSQSTSGGVRSAIRVFDAGGAVTLRREIAGEAMVSADPSGGRVAFTGADGVREIDTRSGAEHRFVPGARAARYDPAGQLVVVRPGGTVEWLTP